MSLEDKKIRRNVVGLLNSGRAIDEWGPTLTGLLLERILSTLIPIDGMDLVLTSLETGETLNVVLPKTSKFISNKDLKEIISSTNQLDKLQANVLYKDLKGNFESFDLFCVVEDPENATKYIMLGLQVTTSNTHPVKYNGVKNMFNAFPDDIKKNLSKPIIAFVTLPKGTLKSKQPIHDKDKKVVKEITAPVNLFRQYVCRYKISK